MALPTIGSIGMLGSISIAVNSLTGPAMLNLPATFARSGIIPTIATLLFVCVLSSLCSLHMANSISKVHGNSSFKKEVEYSEVFRIFVGKRWFILTQILYFCCITCLNISSIVDTAEFVDTLTGIWWPGGSAAVHVAPLLQFGKVLGKNHQRKLFDDITSRLDTSSEDYTQDNSEPNMIRWVRWDHSECTSDDILDGLCLPFAKYSDGYLITVGNVVTTITFAPLALMDLKDNSYWQVVGFFILIITSMLFVVQFAWAGLETSFVTWWGYEWDDLLGVVLFNFALVIAVPAWLYEREPHVDVPTVIHGSSSLAVILYIAIGLMGAMALPNVSDNMLESMILGAEGASMQLGASLFAIAIVGLGIPLFSVVTRLNLTSSGLCSMRTGYLLSVFLPFAISWFLNDGQAITKLLSWGGVIFTSLVAFILPLGLALYVSESYDHEGFVSVYGRWLTDKPDSTLSLRVLLVFAVLAIGMAIAGNFFQRDH